MGKQLHQYCEKVGISYIHIPELGIPSHLRKNLNGEESYRNLFQYYSESILPNQPDALNKLSKLLTRYKRIALTCFENNHSSCHRHKITDHFKVTPGFVTPIIHL